MGARQKPSSLRQFIRDTPGVILFALPHIIGGGVVGALLGAALGSAANGFRVGVILGGAVAFVRLKRRTERPTLR